MEILKQLGIEDHREDIINAINNAVQLRHSIAQSREDLKEIADQLKEDYEIKTVEFNAVVDALYKQDIAEREKKISDLAQAVNIVTNA